jgi:hypothetical protein
MIQITAQMRVLVAIEPVDGRKGIDSLARLCQEKLAEDPFSDACLVVARGGRTSQAAGSVRSAVADGGGGSFPGASRADVAASERAEIAFWPCVPRKTDSYYRTMVTFRYRGREIHPGDILYVR